MIDFKATIISGAYSPGSSSSSTDLLLIDGYVQTVTWAGLRLFHGGRGIVTVNTVAIPSPHYAAFLSGSDLEIESCWAQAVSLDYCSRFWSTGHYTTGSVSTEGMFFGANARMIKIGFGEDRDHWKDGIVSYADGVELHGLDVFRNARAGKGNWDGVRVMGGNPAHVRWLGWQERWRTGL